jgi:hypothetical protein
MRDFDVCAIFIALAVAGCATSDIDTHREALGDATLIVARPSSRLISERPRLLGAQQTQVLCTEPSPDVAIALARSGNLAASGSAPSGPSASLSGTFSSSETASLLAGRTAGVVALRDGLYVACQAYVNGVIGHDSYALILSQYGILLNQLVGSNAGSTSDKPGSSDKGGGVSTALPGAMVLTVAGGSITSPATNSGKSTVSSPTGSTTTQSTVDHSKRDDLLLVACIDEFDPTRIRPLDASGRPVLNELLHSICGPFVERLAAESQQTATSASSLAQRKLFR